MRSTNYWKRSGCLNSEHSKLNGPAALSAMLSWRIRLQIFFFALGLIPTAYGQSGYGLQIVAKTGDQTPGGNTIMAFGTEPSINDAGKVAFTIKNQLGHVAVFEKNGSVVEKDFGLYTSDITSTAVQINNADQMTVRDQGGAFPI